MLNFRHDKKSGFVVLSVGAVYSRMISLTITGKIYKVF